jgi:hypothetical protein
LVYQIIPRRRKYIAGVENSRLEGKIRVNMEEERGA